MNNNRIPIEPIYQIISLLISFIIVHATYVTVIRPAAKEFMAQQVELAEQDPNYQEERNFYVVLKDYEQEACIVLMLWAIAIIGYKGITTWRQQQLLSHNLLKLPDGLPLGPEDIPELKKRLAHLPDRSRSLLLPRALAAAIHRFGATRNVQDAATAVKDLCDVEAERQETELSIIKYIAWAIPSVGFIGTVRGIGAALAQAHKAVEGDITGVTNSLGVAFNSTFIALILSIVLMFLIHQLQAMQDKLVLDTEEYCDGHLISRLRSGPPA